MSTPWEDDVAEALRCAYAGQCENWPLAARTLAAEITELRGKLIDKLAEDMRRCPQCGRLADSVETRADDGRTRYHHGQFMHVTQPAPAAV